MNLKPTQKSLDMVVEIATKVATFHHHYHILFDIAETFGEKKINYLEIGAYAGGSSCLMLQRPNTTIISIDLGEPISKGVVFENVLNYKNNNNYYKYIQGSSQVIETKNQVIEALSNSRALGFTNKIDLLFIDGDHSLNGVIADFNMYSDLVVIGGYIVFDDYYDDIHSPDVKKALDEIILPNLVDYEIIGTLENTLGAYPSELKNGNCFVIKRIN
jgi:predicted O-methyltransferase YrrM